MSSATSPAVQWKSHSFPMERINDGYRADGVWAGSVAELRNALASFYRCKPLAIVLVPVGRPR